MIKLQTTCIAGQKNHQYLYITEREKKKGQAIAKREIAIVGGK